MKKLRFTFIVLVAALGCIQSAQAALVTAGELIVDLRNQDLNASTNVWVNHATSTNSVGDFMRLDSGNLTVVPGLSDTNAAANALQVDTVQANALISALQTPAVLEGTNSRSVEIWIYPLSDGATSCTVGWGNSGTAEQSSFTYNTGGNGMFSGWFADTGWGGYPLPINQWVYVVYTYDGANVSGYINGTFVTSAGLALNTSHHYLCVGAARNVTADPFKGRIGDVRVHTGVLSDLDIANNYAEGMVAPDLSPIITGLDDESIYVSQDITLEPTVGGGLPLFYQWSSNSVDIAGATNATLSLTNVQLAADGTVYGLVVSNSYGTTSDSMILTVQNVVDTGPVTVNVDISSGSALYSGLARAPGTGTVWNQVLNPSGSIFTIAGALDSHGDTLDSVEVTLSKDGTIYIYNATDPAKGNPNPLDLMSDYAFQGPYTVDVFGLPVGEYDLYVYAHGDNSGQSSTITVAATNGGAFASTTSTGDYRDIYQTNALGNSYLVLTGSVTSASATFGTFTFTSSAYLNGFQVQSATPVIEGLSDMTVPPGTNLVLNGGVTGRRPMTFQWSYNGNPMVGETNETIVLNNVQPAQAGEYSLEVSNSIGSDSGSMTLMVESGAAPVIESISVAGGTADITWVSDAGSGYSIESASDLVASNWAAVVTGLTSAGTNTTPVTMSGNDEEFFRISK